MIDFDIVVTEPANIVLAEGEEVALEFEEALDAGAATAAGATAAGATAAEPVEDFSAVMPPAAAAAATAAPGQRLGGEIRYNPDGTRWNPWRDGPLKGVQPTHI